MNQKKYANLLFKLIKTNRKKQKYFKIKILIKSFINLVNYIIYHKI